jgi:DNA-binding CsgD family transcriptional regulator
MQAFAARAGHELQAIGHRSHARTVTTPTQRLTAQETQIALMARAGLSNPEIGARLFISSRTVQYHLKKVYFKLDIRSRAQLETALPATDDEK